MAEVDAVHISAPAKINLFLRVLAREISGYHQIETLFAAVDFCDEIRVERAEKGVSLDVVGADVGPVEENLAYRAVLRFREATSANVGLHMRLTKNIPAGAGLGGGSSDAGAALRALNMLFDNPVSESELLRCAADLGSDVPFFASGVGRALAWGRGEQLLPLPTDEDVTVLLALPRLKVSTADAFQELEPDVRAAPSAHDLAAFEQSERLAEVCVNDFESSVFARHPELGALRGSMEDEGALTARLSGTGAALFALFDGPVLARSASESLSSSWPDIQFVVTQTLALQPKPSVVT